MRSVRILFAALMGVLALVYGGLTVIHALWYEAIPLWDRNDRLVSNVVMSHSAPVRIIIPALNIHAVVEHTGLTANGRMAVPRSFGNVGWYVYGTAPGASGTAIMLGHLDNGLGLDGVFRRLKNLQPGDGIDVVTENGSTLHFFVTSLTIYPYDDVPVEALGSASAARLALITCAGRWIYDDEQGMTYDHRLIVLADAVSE